jgi:peptidoglycan/LPS O-acetylase OafA/YrhL
MGQTANNKLGVINGLRGFAIIFVIYHHVFGGFTYPGWYSFYFSQFNLEIYPFTYLSNGWIGVNLFFILSGLVLYIPYKNDTRKMRSFQDITGFYRHRAMRLLPLYYISLLIMVFLNGRMAIDSLTPERLLYMATFTFGFTKDLWFPKYNPVLWSLAVEFWFCMLFPFFIILAKRFGIYRVLLFALGLSLAARFIGVYVPFFETQNSAYQGYLKDSLLGRLDDFVLGMFIGHIYISGKEGSVKFLRAFGIPLGLALLFIGCQLWDYKFLGQLPNYLVPFLNNIIQAGFLAIIISVMSFEKCTLKAFFTNYPIQILGMMCYSVYIWHRIAQFMILKTGYTAMNLTLYFLFLTVFSALTYRFIEFGHKSASELFSKAA